MLLCHRHRFLFIHVAKTGGTSIRAALRWECHHPYQAIRWLCSRLSGLTGHRLGVKLPRHAKAVGAKELLPRDLFDALFKFAFVRNPWDLQVSSYHHVRRERPHLLQNVPDFPSFVRWKLDPERPYHYIVDASAEPQVDHLRDLSGRILVDFVGSYECLQEDFDFVCRAVGIRQRTLPHERRSRQRRDYREYYDDLTAQRIADHFAADIAAFGYTFEGGVMRRRPD